MTVDRDLGVRSWWPRVLWQAVTLWLVNRGMAVHRGRSVEQVCNRKETTSYENHVVRFRQSGQSESRVEQGKRSRSEALVLLWRYGMQGGASIGTPGSKNKIRGKKKSPLYVYVSPSISQTYNRLCAPFENKMREIYFYKKVYFVSFIEVRSLSLIIFLVRSMRCIQHSDYGPNPWPLHCVDRTHNTPTASTAER